jgi:protein-S-isoprenylcysteine O-methyltransferase Ste14
MFEVYLSLPFMHCNGSFMILTALLPLGFSVSPLFPSGIAELLFILVYFLWFYFELINQAFIALKYRKSRIKIKNDKLSLLGIYFSVILVLYASGYFGTLRLDTGFAALPAWTCYLGLGMMVFGESLRQWSTFTLGKFFTSPVIIAEDHKLIIKGPYKLVRHPGYLGGLIAITGIGIALQSWAAGLAAFVIISLAYSYRLYLEEKTLRGEFGRQYENYAKKTRMIIPYVL